MMAPLDHDAADGLCAERLVGPHPARARGQLEVQPAALADPAHLELDAGLDERVEVEVGVFERESVRVGQLVDDEEEHF